jgi:hypothetical protein
MKNSILAMFVTLLLASATFGAIPLQPPIKVDIYPKNWDGSVIYNKVFTVSPAMPNGATTFTNGTYDFARVFVVTASCAVGVQCMKKNITYTISGGDCFNRWRVKFLTGYSWTTEPSVVFSELYDGNEGFQISGGSQYTSSLLPRVSINPCG